MVLPGRPAVLPRWVLLPVLVFAVLGMHNLVADGTAEPSMAAHPPAMSAGPSIESGCCADHQSGHHGQVPGHGHDLQHLCLAILIAVGALILGSLLWRRRHAPVARGEPISSVPFAGRSPPSVPKTRDLLSSLCVLRL